LLAIGPAVNELTQDRALKRLISSGIHI